MKRSALLMVLMGLGFLSLFTGCDDIQDFPSGSGYAAKNICSGVFVSHIDRNIMAREYVAPEIDPYSRIWRIDADYLTRSVYVNDIIFNDYYASEAMYRDGLGCTCLINKTPLELLSQMPLERETLTLPCDLPWPLGSAGIHPLRPENMDYAAVEIAIDRCFREDRDLPKKTVAVAIVYKGKLVAERYAKGFTPFTPILGWSMSKSVTGTLIGMQQDMGLLDVKDPSPFEAWAGTEKEGITIENLLHMSSGLEFHEETQGENNDLAYMLYSTDDYAAYMLERELIHEPGTVWNYSTGETMLLAKIVQDNIGGTLSDAYHFIHGELFHKIAIAHAVVEFDPSGTFVGGAGVMMPARDWARLGLLYLQDGLWDGQRVLPQGWVAYARTPCPANPSYGAQIWLNNGRETWPSLPDETVSFLGHNCQRVVIVPSRDLVVVRMGYTFDYSVDPTEQLVREVMQSIH